MHEAGNVYLSGRLAEFYESVYKTEYIWQRICPSHLLFNGFQHLIFTFWTISNIYFRFLLLELKICCNIYSLATVKMPKMLTAEQWRS